MTSAVRVDQPLRKRAARRGAARGSAAALRRGPRAGRGTTGGPASVRQTRRGWRIQAQAQLSGTFGELPPQQSVAAVTTYPPPIECRRTIYAASAGVGALCAAAAPLVMQRLALQQRAFFSASFGVIVGLLIAFVSNAIAVDRVYKRTLLRYDDPALLREGSRFVNIGGIDVHTIAPEPRGSPIESPAEDQTDDDAQFLCFHGFGSNALSFELLAQLLHEKLRGRLMAFDFPGFGFTRRPRQPKEYGIAASTRIGLALMAKVIRHGVVNAHRDGGEPQECEGSGPHRVVLIGHSLGGNIAARVAAAGLISGLVRKEDIRAIVLVAPALLSGGDGGGGGGGGRAPILIEAIMRTAVVALSGALGFALRWASRGFALITALLIRFPLRYPIYELLRRLVYRPSFWRKALRYAVLDAKAVTEKFIDNYSCPRRILDWEYGFLMFVVSQLSLGTGALIAGEKKLDSDAKLVDYLREMEIPILIVHGSADAVVPLSNSVNLVQRQRSGREKQPRLCVMKAGHVPHEEDGEEFVKLVLSFLEESRK